MDPITTAIVVALGKLAEPAVRDSYEAPKRLLAKKFVGVKDAADRVEQAPESQARQAVLAEEVEKSGACRDEEVRPLLEELLKRLGAPACGGTSVTQKVSGSGHIFSGTGDVNVRQT